MTYVLSVGLWVLWFAYYVALVAVILGVGWSAVAYVLGNRYLRAWRERPASDESAYLWVFLVPALNEAVTIADSVARLRATQATHRVILVINDGSDDNTGEVLDSITGPDLTVLTRVPPNARIGKAAALNAAYHYLRTDVLTQPRYRHWRHDQVIVGIVDADGRLAADAPTWVARQFDVPRCGGVQVNVNIYNQTSYLTRMQALEFRVFGGLFQLGRSELGVAFMGGNGQFNRLAALDSIVTGDGPWSDYLTEDQELGLRLLSRGWFGQHEPMTHVDQQGLNSLRRLYRQRARWMQGNLQVFTRFGRLNAHHLTGLRRIDAMMTLLLPVLTLIVGTAVLVALILWVGFGVPFLPLGQGLLTALVILLAIGPVTLGVLVVGRGRGLRGFLEGLRVLVPYLLYVWLMWPVTYIGLINLIKGKQAWAKTAREAIAPGPDVT